MLLIPNFAPKLGTDSVFTFANLIWGSNCKAAASNAGPIILQGPHQGAQKSTKRGMSLRLICFWKLAFVSSTGFAWNSAE